MSLRILIAESAAPYRAALERSLAGHHVFRALDIEELMAALGEERFSLIVVALDLAPGRARQLVERLVSADPDAAVVVTVDDPGAREVREALVAGAYDWLQRGADAVLREATLRRAVERVGLTRENRNLLSSLKRNVEAFGYQNRKLEEMATRDGLTGLFNQRYFREALELELSRCRRHGHHLSLIFADVDFFKKYNDTHGHQAGDALLVALAELITRESRRSTVVARYGGEEFVLLVPETDRPGVLAYAEKLRRVVETHPFGGREALPGGKISMSFGVASFPEDGQDSEALLKCADDALYRAKDRGRNAVAG